MARRKGSASLPSPQTVLIVPLAATIGCVRDPKLIGDGIRVEGEPVPLPRIFMTSLTFAISRSCRRTVCGC